MAARWPALYMYPVHPGTHLNPDVLKLELLGFSGLMFVGALVCAFLALRWRSQGKPRQRVEMQMMFGVDITDSRYLQRPVCVAAAQFANRAHEGAFRKSGQPYVMHCVETAVITEQLIEMHFSDEMNNKRADAAIITALLHDVVDDTSQSLDDVRLLFGDKISQLVKGVSQLSRNNQLLRRRHRQLLEAGMGLQAAAEVEAMKSMIIQMTDEPLVIIVKIADRLHNMRTVWALKPKKARYLAQETMEVWCPICEYLGLGAVKSELEDICFAVLETDQFECVKRQLDHLLDLEESTSADRTCELPADADAAAPDLLTACTEAAAASRPPAPAAVAAADVAPADVAPVLYTAADLSRGPQRTRAVDGMPPRLDLPPSAPPPAPRPADADAGPAASAGDCPPPPQLSAEQRRLAAALAEVVPFSSNNFISMHQAHCPRHPPPPVVFLSEASKLLMREIDLEGVASGLRVQIQGRLKSLTSIHKKMKLKRVPLRQVYDTLALRVVISDAFGGDETHNAIRACYRIRTLVNRLWRPVETEYDDYIARPKPSGYQSIHMAVLGPQGIPMEVQIRTSSMHHVAEYGSASHWAYKDFMKSQLHKRPAPVGGVPAAPPRPPQPAAAPAPRGGPHRTAEEYAARVLVGQPLRLILDGQPGEGVVVDVHPEARQLVAATVMGRRWEARRGIADPLSQESYDAMITRVNTRGWHVSGQGDSTMRLYTFQETRSGQHHLIDRFGAVSRYSMLAFVDLAPGSPAWMKPRASADPAPPAARAEAAGRARSPAARARSPAAYRPGAARRRLEPFEPAALGGVTVDPDRVVQLRAAFEWGDSAGGQAPMPLSKQELYNIYKADALIGRVRPPKRAGGKGEPGDRDDGAAESLISVLVEPGGIQMLPPGTTAGDIVRAMGYLELGSREGSRARGRLVNVNNQLVPEDTPLTSGDLVVLSDAILSNV